MIQIKKIFPIKPLDSEKPIDAEKLASLVAELTHEIAQQTLDEEFTWRVLSEDDGSVQKIVIEIEVADLDGLERVERIPILRNDLWRL